MSSSEPSTHATGLVFALLALGATAFGCQVVAGLTDLELGASSTTAASTGGGEGGSGGQGGSGGNTGGGGSGGGPECALPADCGAATDCLAFTCDAGTCLDAPALLGAPCDDGGNDAEVCDGEGACVARSCADTVQNGDETDVDCGGDECAGCEDGLQCVDDGDCLSTYCDPARGLCGAAKGPGEGCTLDAECASDHCTDGVCCDVADCGAECLRCDVTGQEGTCQSNTGAACGDGNDDGCTNPDTCDGAGVCQPNHEGVGTGCGDPTVSLCTAADTCDGAGQCLPNHAVAQTPCGNALDDACTNPDTCNGQGVCLLNDALVGTSCGGVCQSGTNQAASTCNGSGTCQGAITDCLLYNCNAAGTACRTSCAVGGDCADDAFCAQVPQTCAPCGATAPQQACSVAGPCESCSAGTCVKTCDTGGECTGNIVPAQPPSDYRIECKNQCNNTTIACPGGVACDVVCEAGGCNGLTVICNPEGPCTLTCMGGSCAANVSILCGDNACGATCAGNQTVSQTCASSCGCTKTGCQ